MEIIEQLNIIEQPEIIKKKRGRPFGTYKKDKVIIIRRDKIGRPPGSLNKKYKYDKVDGVVVYPQYTIHKTDYILCSKCGAYIKQYCSKSHEKSVKCKYIADNIIQK